MKALAQNAFLMKAETTEECPEGLIRALDKSSSTIALGNQENVGENATQSEPITPSLITI